jgi:hypothetical protein
MITIQKVTSNVQSVPRHCLNTWINLTDWQPTARARGTLDPILTSSVILNSNYVIMVSD